MGRSSLNDHCAHSRKRQRGKSCDNTQSRESASLAVVNKKVKTASYEAMRDVIGAAGRAQIAVAPCNMFYAPTGLLDENSAPRVTLEAPRKLDATKMRIAQQLESHLDKILDFTQSNSHSRPSCSESSCTEIRAPSKVPSFMHYRNIPNTSLRDANVTSTMQEHSSSFRLFDDSPLGLIDSSICSLKRGLCSNAGEIAHTKGNTSKIDESICDEKSGSISWIESTLKIANCGNTTKPESAVEKSTSYQEIPITSSVIGTTTGGPSYSSSSSSSSSSSNSLEMKRLASVVVSITP